MLQFAVSKDKANQTAFANIALAVLLGRNVKGHSTRHKLGCNVTGSDDGKTISGCCDPSNKNPWIP